MGSSAASSPSNQVTPRVPPTPPTIAINSAPLFPPSCATSPCTIAMNHRQQIVNFFKADIALQIGVPAGSSGVVLSASSSNPAVLPASGVSFFPASRTTSGSVQAYFKPLENQFGMATITLTATDADDGTNIASLPVSVQVDERNRRPTATYIDAVRLPASAAAGAYMVPNAALSLSPGEGEELAQQAANAVVAVHRDNPNPPSVSFASNTLHIQFDAPVPTKSTLYALPTDDSQGAFPSADECISEIVNASLARNDFPSQCNLWRAIRINVGDVAGVGVEVRRAQLVAGKSARKGAAASTTPISYRIRVVNNGSVPLQGVRITAVRPPALLSPTWTCTAPAGGCTPASGSGAVDTQVNLDLDEIAEVIYSGEIDSTTHYLVVAAHAALPEDAVGHHAPEIGQPVLFDVVSDVFLHYSGFEDY